MAWATPFSKPLEPASLTSNVAWQGIGKIQTDSILHPFLRAMADGRFTERGETRHLQKYDTSSRDGFFGLQENPGLAHIHCACAKTLLTALAVYIAEENLAVARNTWISSAAFA